MSLVLITVVLLVLGCGGCGGGSESDRLGVGAQCASSEACDDEPDDGLVLVCLPVFKGGYCGIEGCVNDLDCPEDAGCVAHDDGHNYCFRLCIDKPDCNANRDLDNEANCSSSVTFTDPTNGRKACVPPSSGI